ncbi:hypothetical protein LUZ60_012560 [Juncus effusus]|nr:hypothetical protein LUZ60_012560 [Juncus effusus]
MARPSSAAAVGSTPPLSQFGVLVAQLESIAASAPHQPPDPVLCFDLLSQLVSAVEHEPKESIQLWQRKCEEALFALLTLGARRPVRRLASAAMGRVIEKGDGISIYSRASSLQGFLADGKKTEPLSCAGAAQCLGELYRLFGRKITGGLVETTNIVSKLMKYNEDYVKQDALLLLENALSGSEGGGGPAAYTESFRIITKLGVTDKSFIVRLAGARCLRTFGSVGWIGLGVGELENSMAFCVKGLEDQVSSVRDAFAEALGALLALAMNPEAQGKMKKGKNQAPAAKKSEDSLHKYLIAPFIKASGNNAKKLRIGLVLSWVFFLQVIHLKYHFAESELQNFALKAIEMLQGNNVSTNPHALACVLYILRVGVADQLTEPAQRDFLVLLGRKLESLDNSPSMRVATLRILSYLLKSLGEVPSEFKDVLDNTVVSALSHSSVHVRVEAALTLCSLAEVDPTCVGGLVSLGVTTLHALRETVSYDRGSNNLSVELASLHGQATVLAALVAISPKLLLGYPARLPKSVFEVAKKMLNTVSRNPVASAAVKEAGWLLLASLVSSMPKEELEDQAFDILLLWAGCFAGNVEYYMRTVQDWASELRVLSVAIEALTAFIKTFIFPKTSSSNSGILLQPVLAYLSGALNLISLLCAKPPQNVKPALDLFTARVLMAYQSISDPLAYKSDHSQIMRICSSPFSDPSGWEESSLLRVLLDKRDACLGPWIPGRDSFEDELRGFDGGVDGILPCVWDDEIGNFPQPESVSRMLVNQMLSCFGTIFACQDNREKIVILNRIDQSVKTEKRRAWYWAFVSNACVGLLSGLKSVLALRPQALSAEILNNIQSIFQAILVESDNSAQRRAACEGLGLLGRVANDVFTARMTRSLLGELATAVDPNYSGSIALSLGCIHSSAGGMALSVLVPSTVNAISTLCKSSNLALQLWSLHALLLTIEAAGLSYVPQVQATLLLVMEILLLDENGYVDLRQEIGHLINAIVAVIGPELSPGSTFFSRCQSVIAEISSCNETAALLESVRFTQQLVLFAPQAATVHSHVQNLIPTLFSRQPSLRHLAVSTLRHLIERDPDEMIKENIEESLFSMLDEETDSEIANLVRTTINRLLSSSCPKCPSRWLTILHNMVLATSQGRIESQNDGQNGANENEYYNDDEDMISSAKQEQKQQTNNNSNFARRNKYLRYRTRVFAAECLSCVPNAVGTDPAHFDLSLARNQTSNSDWLVLKLQDLVSLSYQISTGQFEGMQPTGVRLLSVIMDKFANTADPEFPGHILLEQYQAQLVSAVRSTINTSSGPLLLDSGLELATKILTSSIVGGDRVALNRLYLLISRPLSEIQDLCYPSFADWVACKIKIRILTAHASVKCYTYQFFRKEKEVPDEYLQLVPLLSNNSAQLGKFWIGLLKDYIYIICNSHLKSNYKPFLDGIDSPIVSSKVSQYLSDSWHLILQSTALDSVPVNSNKDSNNQSSFISGHKMVDLEKAEFQFIWGLSMLVLFRCQGRNGNFVIFKEIDEGKVKEVVLRVFFSFTKEVFFEGEFVSDEMCKELLQALVCVESNELIVSLLSQIIQKCPDAFYETESFVFSAMQLCSRCLITTFQSFDESYENHNTSALLSELSTLSETMVQRMKFEHKWKFATSLISLSYQSYIQRPTNLCLSKVISFLHNIIPFLNKHFKEDSELHSDIPQLKSVTSTWASTLSYFSKECTKKINLENKSSESSKLFAKILIFSLQEIASLAQLVYETHSNILERERETDDFDSLVSSLLTHCSECFSNSFCDSNSQVQILGLHVLKTLAQRELTKGAQAKSSYFTLLLGELLQDIFDLLHNTLKRCESREEVMVIEESLKLLFLFYTVVKSKEYQKDVTMLLLEVFLLVFSLSKNSNSHELEEANCITRRLVSHFVQIPLAASQIKDIMLTVSAEKRQQLQDMIRVSVGQGQITTNVEPAANNDNNENNNENNNNNDNNNNDENNNDDEFEDDDWDAFQSLPATNNNNNNNNNADAIYQESESTDIETANKEENEASNEENAQKDIITDETNQESESTNTENIVDLTNKEENEELSEENKEKELAVTHETNQESEFVSTEKESQELEIPEPQENVENEGSVKIIENQNLNIEQKEGNVELIIEDEECRFGDFSSVVESENISAEKIEQSSEDSVKSLDIAKEGSSDQSMDKEKDESKDS